MVIPAWADGEREVSSQEGMYKHICILLSSVLLAALLLLPTLHGLSELGFPVSSAAPARLASAQPGTLPLLWLCSWSHKSPLRGIRGPGFTAGCQLYVGV